MQKGWKLNLQAEEKEEFTFQKLCRSLPPDKPLPPWAELDLPSVKSDQGLSCLLSFVIIAMHTYEQGVWTRPENKWDILTYYTHLLARICNTYQAYYASSMVSHCVHGQCEIAHTHESKFQNLCPSSKYRSDANPIAIASYMAQGIIAGDRHDSPNFLNQFGCGEVEVVIPRL